MSLFVLLAVAAVGSAPAVLLIKEDGVLRIRMEGGAPPARLQLSRRDQ